MPDLGGAHKYAIGISGILIFLSGCGSFITGCFWLSFFNTRGISTDGSGIWSGMLLIIAGTLGLVAWRKNNKGLVIAFLVLCILACVAASSQAVIAGTAHSYLSMHSDRDCHVSYYGYCSCINNKGQRINFKFDSTCKLVSTFIAGLISILSFNVLGAFLALAGSIYGCMAAANGNQTPGTVASQPVSLAGVESQPGQAMVYVQQQPGVQPQYNMGYAQQPAGAGPQATPESA